MQKSRGFTLIELIVAMAILAILAAVSVPNFNQFRRSSALLTSSETVGSVLGKSFSAARSQSLMAQVEGKRGASDFLFLKCEKYSDCKNAQTTETIALETGVVFQKDFLIRFRPPFGDVDKKASSNFTIVVQNDAGSISIKVHPKSGLVSSQFSKEVGSIETTSETSSDSTISKTKATALAPSKTKSTTIKLSDWAPFQGVKKFFKF